MDYESFYELLNYLNANIEAEIKAQEAAKAAEAAKATAENEKQTAEDCDCNKCVVRDNCQSYNNANKSMEDEESCCGNCVDCEECENWDNCPYAMNISDEDYDPDITNLIDRVIFNETVTVVHWVDGTKTVVKCCPGDKFTKETGVALAVLKKIFGDNYYKQIDKVIKNQSVDKTSLTLAKREAKAKKQNEKMTDADIAEPTSTSTKSTTTKSKTTKSKTTKSRTTASKPRAKSRAKSRVKSKAKTSNKAAKTTKTTK